MPKYPSDPSAELDGTLTAITAGTPTAAVASQLLRYFTSGGLEPGSRLPSERKLSELLGTGRSAVREALSALEILGMVDVRPGSGTYLHSDASELLPRTLSWGLMLGSQSAEDLLEIRSALEVLAVKLVSQQPASGTTEALQGQIDDMARHTELADHQAFVEADARFHQEIAAASGNQALGTVLQSVRALLRVWVDRSVDDAADARTALEEHAAIMDALAAGDSDAAVSAMERHMRTASERILSAKARGHDTE